MTVLTDKEFIRRRFSDAALHYSDRADIQTAIARELAARMQDLRGALVLDVGAGDGIAAQALAMAGVHVVALDGAWGMVHAGHVRSSQAAWLQADAGALPFASGSFDAVISSSAYQWVDDLPLAFSEARRVLKPGGKFVAAMFAQGTLEELFVSMQRAAAAGGRTLPALKRLPAAEAVRSALGQAGLKDLVMTVERRVVGFPDLKAMLRWLKGIGANALTMDFFWGKALLAATEKEYRLNFSDSGQLCATFEILWIEARV